MDIAQQSLTISELRTSDAGDGLDLAEIRVHQWLREALRAREQRLMYLFYLIYLTKDAENLPFSITHLIYLTI